MLSDETQQIEGDTEAAEFELLRAMLANACKEKSSDKEAMHPGNEQTTPCAQGKI